MIINTLAAMCGGFVLSLMFGNPPGMLDPDKLIALFVRKLRSPLLGFYENSPEARRMAGRICVLFTVLVFAAVPLVLMVIAYKLLPVLGLILDCFFCWAALSVRDSRNLISQAFRGIRSGNLDRTRKALTKLSGTDCSALDRDDLIRRSVECAADCASDSCVSPLFYCAIAGGFGGMLFKTISVMNRTLNTSPNPFGTASRNIWSALSIVPASICSTAIKADARFLKLDYKNSSFVSKRDLKKLKPVSVSACRCAMAGALDMSLTEADGEPIGEQLKECSHNDIYWANQLLYGAAFGCLILFALIRLIAAALL